MALIRHYSSSWEDYELLDAGHGKKLERFGPIVTIRPEVQAYFKPGWSLSEWNKLAHWEFIEKSTTQGTWKPCKPNFPRNWKIRFHQLQFHLELTRFKHVGIFPEQVSNWQFIQENLLPGHKFLNLFAYTGAASLVARQTGAETIHVDSVRQLITWANENQALSGLSGIKWVHEDALKFAQREAKRGNAYDFIVMDPPAFGLGAGGEKWILEQQLPGLIEVAHSLLKPDAWLVLNTYSPKISPQDLQRHAHRFFPGGKAEVSELRMKTQTGKDLYYGNLLRARK